MKILVVDDEVEFCHQVSIYLESRGYIVHTESDGNSALKRFDELVPDIIIIDVDLGLRNIDGRAICIEVTRSTQYVSGGLGIVMISGHYIAPGDEILGFEIGADNYLIKPFELKQLSARIEALRRRIGLTTTNGVLTHGDLQLDIDGRIVRESGNILSLSRLEFDVLAYLVAQSGQVKTKTQLLENVWETQHIEDGAIAKCVSLLRRKISPDKPERYIQTVHGVGYRFKSDDSTNA